MSKAKLKACIVVFKVGQTLQQNVQKSDQQICLKVYCRYHVSSCRHKHKESHKDLFMNL